MRLRMPATHGIPDPPASLRRRLAALTIDYVIIGLWLTFLTVIAVSFPSMGRFFQSPASGQIAGLLVLTLPVLLYLGLWEGSALGATPGKRAVGIVVRRSNGDPLGRFRGLARNALKLVPWELAHTCLWRIPDWPRPTGELPGWVVAGLITVWVMVLVNLLLAWKSRANRTAYDWAVDSVVFRSV
jgi:uncharacterized RDD family membrane protein YckC